MSTLDQKLVESILSVINNQLSQGILPVHNGHLEEFSDETDVLVHLITMKEQGLISGDLVTKGVNNTPYRMTNIRLTYLGIRVLRS